MFKKIITALITSALTLCLISAPAFASEDGAWSEVEIFTDTEVSVTGLVDNVDFGNWKIKDEEIADISEAGIITGVSAGSTEICISDGIMNTIVTLNVEEVLSEMPQDRMYFSNENASLIIKGGKLTVDEEEHSGFYFEKAEDDEKAFKLYSMKDDAYLGYNEERKLGIGEEFDNDLFRIIKAYNGQYAIATYDMQYAVSHIIDDIVELQPLSLADWQWQLFDLNVDDDFEPGWPSSDTFMVTGLDYYYYSGGEHNNGRAADIGDGQKGHSVNAIEDGVVIAAANDCEHVNNTGCECHGGSGNYISISHSNGYVSKYLHLEKDTLLVNVGDKVKKGDQIATMGSSGRSSGYHVHLALMDEKGSYLYVFDYYMHDKDLMKKVTFAGAGPKDGRYHDFIKSLR